MLIVMKDILDIISIDFFPRFRIEKKKKRLNLACIIPECSDAK
jgi:hypothetical protein